MNYFRVIENGFSLKGSRLERPLLRFLASGEYALESVRWAGLKSLRDTLSHAYKSGQATHSEDVMPHLEHMKHIAMDVLAHKKTWHNGGIDRHDRSFWRARMGVGNEVVLVRGTKMQLNLQLRDIVTDLPVHLAAEELIRNYKRYYKKIARGTAP